ncbi:MAG: HyaD/HybD family hydrogenase maturation endopeptidase [Rubrimonas sp.]|uniref:HyaD/HybD family hydrogenase maturation endopeptidase n=1 Tax=Rubrimonas sp. TaxID=2036015 RepID=UPI002FDEAC06
MDGDLEHAGGALVLGIGNTLLSDEGAGVHALRALEAAMGARPGLSFLDGGTLSFTLAGPIADCDALLVLDTAQLHAEPGTLRVFEGAEMDAFLTTGPKTSVHEVSLMEVLGMARIQDRLPQRRALVGVQPGSLDWGMTPTEAVSAALPRMAALARAKLEAWGL